MIHENRQSKSNKARRIYGYGLFLVHAIIVLCTSSPTMFNMKMFYKDLYAVTLASFPGLPATCVAIAHADS